MLSYFTALGWHLISYLYIQVSYTITCYQNKQSTLYRHQIVPVNRGKYLLHRVKPRVNGHNIVGQQLSTLLDVTCCVCLHILLHVVGTCCTMFENSQTFSYMQMDATLLDVTCCVCLHILLHVVGTCCTMFENSQTFSYMQMDATTPNIGRQCCVRLYRA